jgi:hypothetical protein
MVEPLRHQIHVSFKIFQRNLAVAWLFKRYQRVG